MPFIRFYSHKLSQEKKRELASEMTKTILEAFNLADREKAWCNIHFIGIKEDDYAVCGKLMCDFKDTVYHIDIYEHDLTKDKKQAAVTELTPLIATILDVKHDELYKISIFLYNIDQGDFALGGRFLNHMHTY